MNDRSCTQCGRQYDYMKASGRRSSMFCSQGCDDAFEAAKKAKRSSGEAGGAVDFNKSALGATIGLFSGSSKPKMTEEEKLAELKMEQIRKEQQKEQHENYATKIFEIVNLIKPYFKYIIPLYLIAFGITMVIVKKKDYTMTAIGFAVPLIIIVWAFFNKPKNS